jgi:hypothetical protein
MMGLGDPGLNLDGQPLGQGLMQWTFECPWTCTEKHLGGGKKNTNNINNVTVFAQLLHMHSAGKRMNTSLFRDGRIETEAYVDYYDYRAAGAVAVRQPVVPYDILPGDSFLITCFYESDDTSTVIFGKSFRDEMCISFIWYYPEIRSFHGTCGANNGDAACDGPFTATSLTSNEEMGRIFGSELEHSCKAKSSSSTSETETILSRK